jgi:hypothetical protein
VARAAKPLQTPALVALAGGAVALVSAGLPWQTLGSITRTPLSAEVTGRTADLANGYYLLAGGVVAALCGLGLLLGMAKTLNAIRLLAVGAIVAGALVVGVEATAYSDISEAIKGTPIEMGYGIYVGFVGGVVAIVGGALALRAKL